MPIFETFTRTARRLSGGLRSVFSKKPDSSPPLPDPVLPATSSILLASIADEWDQAEEVIKLAEQVVLDVVIPAVAELRYAGRRIVDGLNAHAAGRPESEVRSFIEEAKFDCLRARHDAIDAALAKMAVDLDLLARQMGYDVIHNSFPAFVDFLGRLDHARMEIAGSRRDRQNRDAIYSAISRSDFPALVKDYKALRRSEAVMRIIVGRKRLGIAIGILAGLAIAVPGWVMGWYFWTYPRAVPLDPSSPIAAGRPQPHVSPPVVTVPPTSARKTIPTSPR